MFRSHPKINTNFFKRARLGTLRSTFGKKRNGLIRWSKTVDI